MGIAISYQFLETEGGGEVSHLPKFPKDIMRGAGESKSLEIYPVFTISSLYTNFIDMQRGLLMNKAD